jgi:diguanylate cyclase (GGDEF)-like protein
VGGPGKPAISADKTVQLVPAACKGSISTLWLPKMPCSVIHRRWSSNGVSAIPHQQLETRQDASADEAVPMRFQRDSLVLMAQRMQLGLTLYPTIWGLLMLIGGQVSHAAFGWAHGLVLVGISVARFFYHRHLIASMGDDITRTRWVFCGMSLAYNLYWGILCATMFGMGQRDNQSWMMLVATVGITAGGTVITASDPVLPRYYAFVTLGPTALALLSQGGWSNLSVTGLILMMVMYSRNLARIARRDHRVAVQAQMLLEQRALELEALSRTDALTRIANRLSFEETLHTAWRLSLRRKEPLSLAVIDLDHFKRINDQHGHPFGDQCLHAAAQAIAARARRPGDLVARYGGEEFVMLMPNTHAEDAAKLAKEVLMHVCQTRVEQGSVAVLLSCSVGVASCIAQASDTPQALVQKADQALYMAKTRGRARVVRHGDPVTEPPVPRALTA